MAETDVMNLLTVCRRAGKLILGTDEVKSSIRGKKAYLVLVARDFSLRSRTDIARVCKEYGVRFIESDIDMSSFGAAFGKVFGIAAVTDAGFARAAVKRLSGGEVQT